MNFKTTLLLVLVLAVCGIFFYFDRPDRREPGQAPLKPVADLTQGVEKKLLDEGALGDVQAITCRFHDRDEEWVFRKTDRDGAETWRIESPLQARALDWQVNKIANTLSNLKYEIAYKPGEKGAVDADAAGLNPPRFVITLEDDQKKSVTFELGHDFGKSDGYVRLSGSDDIVLARLKPGSLLNPTLLEYRDRNLFDFKPEEVTGIEITDRTSEGADPVHYVLSWRGGRWFFEKPFESKATDKVDAMLKALTGARVTKWEGDVGDQVAAYGLDAPALSITVTAERRVKTESDDENEDDADEGDAEENLDEETEKEPAFEVQSSTHALHVSNVTPLGDDRNLYVRVDEESFLGTLPKTTTDKLKPVQSEWRDMKVVEAPVGNARTLRLETPGQSARLVLEDGQWRFADSMEPTEAQTVQALLDALQTLKAEAFIPYVEDDEETYGFKEPRAVIGWTLPDQEKEETIVIGASFNREGKSLSHARVNDAPTVAHVETADVTDLVRPVETYRDRALFSVAPERLRRIEWSCPNVLDEGRFRVALEFDPETGEWRLVEPVQTSARSDRLATLMEQLSTLRVDRFVSRDDDLQTYGLDEPLIDLSITHAASSFPDDADEDEKDEVKDETVSFAIGEKTGDAQTRYYIKKSDAAAIYSIDKAPVDALLAEYHPDKVLDFHEDQVRSFTIRAGDEAHAFEKKDGRWVYGADPDRSLKQTEVQNLLVRLADLRTDRYVQFDTDKLRKYGLNRPAHEVEIALEDGGVLKLLVSGDICEGDPEKRLYATVAETGHVFLLTPGTVSRFKVHMEELAE